MVKEWRATKEERKSIMLASIRRALEQTDTSPENIEIIVKSMAGHLDWNMVGAE